MTRILLTGALGQLGWELQRALAPLGELTASTREGLDLRDSARLRAEIRRLAPDVLVNAAAFAAVDQAQSQRDEVFEVNAHAVALMAQACREQGALFVHFSTDYVFDGAGGAPYREHASSDPVNLYGESKLAGDQAVLASGADHLILRISWLYSLRRRNFLRAVLSQARNRQALRVVGDQRSSPTPAWFVADFCAQLIARRLQDRRTGPASILNLTCEGDASWHEFALAIFEHVGARPELMTALGLNAVPHIEPVQSHDYVTAARRPFDTRLCLEKLRATGLNPVSWRDALAYTLDGIPGTDPS